jgi:hypothetical protein
MARARQGKVQRRKTVKAPTMMAVVEAPRTHSLDIGVRNTGPVPRILNCLPSRETENDWRVDNAVASGILRAAAPIPVRKDLREAWWKIGDQGYTGSCVGWACADSILRWHFVKAGRLGPSEMLSVRFIWMAAKETDEFTSQPTTFIESDGTSLKSALDIARKYGCVKDQQLPFGSGSLYPGEPEDFYALASQLKIASYVNLNRQLDTWRRWIATKGPILTRLTCDNVWMNAKATGGVLAQYDPMSARGGHAVALVGYDQSMFIVRNSWGAETWGDKGFAYASDAYAAAAFTEAYGVHVT